MIGVVTVCAGDHWFVSAINHCLQQTPPELAQRDQRILRDLFRERQGFKLDLGADLQVQAFSGDKLGPNAAGEYAGHVRTDCYGSLLNTTDSALLISRIAASESFPSRRTNLSCATERT